jgi:RNA polymerase sigma-70 factor (ECF subfamily)
VDPRISSTDDAKERLQMEFEGSGGLLALFEEHRDGIARFLRARTRSPAEVQDVVQEMWLRLRESRLGPVTSPRAYLYQMANHLVLDRERERRRRLLRDTNWTQQSYTVVPTAEGEWQALDAGPLPDDSVADVEERRRLLAAMATLPEKARRALILHKIDELSHTEVASRMGISRSAVEKHMSAAMRHLRTVMCTCGEQDSAASLATDRDDT